MDRDTAEEIKHHFDVVMEELRSEIRILAERLQRFQGQVSAEFPIVREKISEVKAMVRSPS